MLFKKMLRDMGRHKTQFVSIFIMAFLSASIYAGIGGEWIGIRNSVNDYYEETNLADVFVYASGLTDEAVDNIKDISSVSEVERRLELNAIGDMEDDPSIALLFVEKNKISSAYIVEGKEFDIDDEDGIWIDKRFADARNIKVGDTISAAYNGTNIEKEVKGIIYSPEYVFSSSDGEMTPDFYANGYAYLSYKAFPYPDMLTYSTLLVKTSETDMDKFEEEVSDALDGSYSIFLTQENHSSVSSIASEIDQHKMIGEIFPVVFFLIALLTMMTTMTRIVTNQRIQIGTLKALGFKKGSITRHYVSYGFWLSLVGSILGIIIGPLTLPYLFYPSMTSFYTLPKWNPSFSISLVLNII